MSRVDQLERAAEREEDALADDFNNGLITREEYNSRMRDIQRDMREAYEQDREDALRDVDAEWGMF